MHCFSWMWHLFFVLPLNLNYYCSHDHLHWAIVEFSKPAGFFLGIRSHWQLQPRKPSKSTWKLDILYCSNILAGTKVICMISYHACIQCHTSVLKIDITFLKCYACYCDPWTCFTFSGCLAPLESGFTYFPLKFPPCGCRKFKF